MIGVSINQEVAVESIPQANFCGKDDHGAIYLFVSAVADAVEVNVIIRDLRHPGAIRTRYGASKIGQWQDESLEICPNQSKVFGNIWALPRVIVAHA